MEESTTHGTPLSHTLDTVAMVTINFVRTFTEPQNIEQGISNVEVTPS
jgi:hypothetical protein